MPKGYRSILGFWAGLLISLILWLPKAPPAPPAAQKPPLRHTQPAHLPVKGKGLKK